MRTRWIGGLAGAGTAALLYAHYVERVQVELSRYTVTTDAQGLPPGGVTILHLSDFHFRADDAVQERKIVRLLELLEPEQYDILALTGDLVHDVGGFPTALRLIRQLQPRWGAFSVPGNHDYAEYSVWGVFDQTWQEAGGATLSIAQLGESARRIADFIGKVLRNDLVRLPVAANDVPAMHRQLYEVGANPLVNCATPVQIPGGELWIAGVDDINEGAPDLAQALADVPISAPLIVLAHNPDIFLDPAIERADLVLCGHTHGGQIKVPLVGVAHTQGTHLTRQEPAGWFRRGRARMFVSRGLGESIPLRFGVRPQAALITLRSGKDLTGG